MNHTQFQAIYLILLAILYALLREDDNCKYVLGEAQSEYQRAGTEEFRKTAIEDPRDGQPISVDNL